MLRTRTLLSYGRLDYCMNNAGIEGVGAPTADQPTDSFEQVRASPHSVSLPGEGGGMKVTPRRLFQWHQNLSA